LIYNNKRLSNDFGLNEKTPHITWSVKRYRKRFFGVDKFNIGLYTYFVNRYFYLIFVW
jgi:hypothetical protein